MQSSSVPKINLENKSRTTSSFKYQEIWLFPVFCYYAHVCTTLPLHILSLGHFFFLSFFFNGHTHSLWNFLGWGLKPRQHQILQTPALGWGWNLSHSSYLSRCSWILNPRCHSGNSLWDSFAVCCPFYFLEVLYMLVIKWNPRNCCFVKSKLV